MLTKNPKTQTCSII